MKHKLYQLLGERNIPYSGFSKEELYQIGLSNVRENIEFYYDKTYTCESVIQELFIQGIKEYIERKRYEPVQKR